MNLFCGGYEFNKKDPDAEELKHKEKIKNLIKNNLTYDAEESGEKQVAFIRES